MYSLLKATMQQIFTLLTSLTVPFEQAERFVGALKAVGSEVDFLPIQGAHHNLCSEELLPWSDEPWEEMGWKALTFFQRHLC